MILLHGHYTFSSMFWEYRYAAYLGAFGVFATAALLTDYWSETSSPESGRAAGIASFVGMAALIWLVTNVQERVDLLAGDWNRPPAPTSGMSRLRTSCIATTPPPQSSSTTSAR